MFDVISNFGYRDVVDIVIVAMIIYYILNIIEKTRTVYVLFGLAVLAGLYLLSQVGELFTLNWILGHFLGSIILIAVILFQNDIRRALITLGRNPLILRLTPGNSQEVLVDEIVSCQSSDRGLNSP